MVSGWRDAVEMESTAEALWRVQHPGDSLGTEEASRSSLPVTTRLQPKGVSRRLDRPLHSDDVPSWHIVMMLELWKLEEPHLALEATSSW